MTLAFVFAVVYAITPDSVQKREKEFANEKMEMKIRMKTGDASLIYDRSHASPVCQKHHSDDKSSMPTGVVGTTGRTAGDAVDDERRA